jgi:hypothetical protein
MPEDLRHVQSMLGLNQPKDWDELQQFLQHQLSAPHATRQEVAPQTPSSSQGLDHISSQAQLRTSDDWAAWTRFVDSRLENTQAGAPAATTSHPGAPSGAPSVASITPGTPGGHLPPILENAALTPMAGDPSVSLRGRRPWHFLHDTNVINEPGQSDWRSYVATFLRQYGYQVDIPAVHGNLGLVRAINPRTHRVFHVYTRTYTRGNVNRPSIWPPRDASTPPSISHILAAVHNKELDPARLGRIFLVHI